MRSPIENSPAHLRWLGIIAARWASLDTFLAMLLQKAMGNSAAAEAVYFSSSSQRLRFDQLRAVIKTSSWPDEEKSTAINLIGRLDDLWCKRNDLLHNPAIADSTHANASYWAQVKRPLKKRPETRIALTLAYLEQHATTLDEVGNQIFDLTWGADFLKSLEPEKQPSSLETPDGSVPGKSP